MSDRPRLAVYAHAVVPPSQTFVVNQIDAFTAFDTRVFGVERDTALTPRAPTFLLAESAPRFVATARVRTYQLTRRSSALRRAVADFSPDVLLAHFAQDAWRVAPIARAVGVPLVVACHGSDVLTDDEHARRGTLSMRQLAGRWQDLSDQAVLFLASSRYVASRLAARGVPEEKIRVRYLGVAIPVVDRPARASARRDVLFVGRLVPSKGVDQLVRAFARIRTADPSVRLTVAGDGPERPMLELLVGRLGLTDAVRFAGVQTPGEVDELMRQHAVLCVPSVVVADGSSEGFGQVVVEAAARSLPVVAYDTGGLSEALGPEGERGGVLLPAGDVDALAATVRELLGDAAVGAALGARGRAYATAHFELGACVRAVEAALLDVASVRAS